MKHSGRSYVLGCALASLASGCTGSGAYEFSANNDAFAGLDEAVVAEVLASPVARERVAGDTEAQALARYQGMVRNFIVCRDALTVYQEWTATGVAPEFPPQPKPTFPTGSGDSTDLYVERFKERVDSGDISQLEEPLVHESGCGVWIPAEPGDGPTIADVVTGKA